MTGSIHDTYVAALQHDIAEVPEDTVKLGVVRRPTPWFYAHVDENIPTLGPPEDLLDAFQERYEELQEEGMDDADAHNAALGDISYDDRYLSYLDSSEEAEAALDDLRNRLAKREDIVLVCYENTEHKRCHRTLLKAELE